MRTIVHLSDLHFGRTLYPTIEPIVDLITRIKPDLVVISGDLTQRARKWQYAEAKAFLARLPRPQLVLPGNHDVPAYNLYRRLLQPLDRYKRIVTRNLSPRFIDDEIAVLGINTARSLVIKGGRINPEQLEWVEGQVATLAHDQVRIVVTHHPLDLPAHLSGVRLVQGAERAMQTFARCRIDLFLCGHLHLVYLGSTARYQIGGYVAPILQAGTATSTRARGEPNSFFVHRIKPDEIVTETHLWDAEQAEFRLSASWSFARQEHGWVPTPG
jgi:3',5'-cyclic AMP phosphodiesterase CpdA